MNEGSGCPHALVVAAAVPDKAGERAAGVVLLVVVEAGVERAAVQVGILHRERPCHMRFRYLLCVREAFVLVGDDLHMAVEPAQTRRIVQRRALFVDVHKLTFSHPLVAHDQSPLNKLYVLLGQWPQTAGAW
ncbi:hypothetical protein EPL73_21340 [Clostridioides difficile]|nr:hypothetical protein [Clostridioides difficile]